MPYHVDESYLQIGDGTSRISATINAPENDYTMDAAHALLNGELHIFGGYSDTYKVLFCVTNQNYEIGRDSIAKFKNNNLDREIRRLLFERTFGAS